MQVSSRRSGDSVVYTVTITDEEMTRARDLMLPHERNMMDQRRLARMTRNETETMQMHVVARALARDEGVGDGGTG